MVKAKNTWYFRKEVSLGTLLHILMLLAMVIATWHNLEKELVKIRLFLDVNAVVEEKPINQGGNYEIDFFFKIEDLKDHYQINNEKPLFSGLFVSTLLAISYSTLRGMMFTLWKDTYLKSVILPVINVPDLLKNKK